MYFIKNRKYYLVLIAITLSFNVFSQIDSSLLVRETMHPDSAKYSMNMDAVYERPFLRVGKSPVAVGGYMESNWQYISKEGISDGHEFQFRRFTLFTSATITNRIKFLAELEFEDGAKEIAIEFAALDFEFSPLLNLRGGMIVNPIGAFNQNHDGPKWEFTDRPIAMTQMLPATWSTTGFGAYGKKNYQDWMIGYEFYLTGGFDRSIIENDQNKTYLPASKENEDRFEESESGSITTSGKLAIKHRKVGELGISHMGGVYNKFFDDGEDIDVKRRVDAFALDINTTLPRWNTNIIAEAAWIWVDVPSTYTQQFGSKQFGGFVDIVQPVLRKRILGWSNAVVNLALRAEYVDWNREIIKETSQSAGEDLWSFMPAISFRPSAQTVVRFNYRLMKERDIFRNPTERTDGFNFGISSYF